jgi:hypothetical protein
VQLDLRDVADVEEIQAFLVDLLIFKSQKGGLISERIV